MFAYTPAPHPEPQENFNQCHVTQTKLQNTLTLALTTVPCVFWKKMGSVVLLSSTTAPTHTNKKKKTAQGLKTRLLSRESVRASAQLHNPRCLVLSSSVWRALTHSPVNGTPEAIYLLLWVRAEWRETLMRIKYAAKQLRTEEESHADK